MTVNLDFPKTQAKQQVFRSTRRATLSLSLLFCCLAVCSSGCWAPFRSYGVPAPCLPDTFRTPMRTAGEPLNFSNLTIQPPEDYILGPNDVLEITIPGLFEGAEVRPIRVQVMASGEIHLPMVGSVSVGDKNLLQAQEVINKGYANGFLVNPRVSLALAEKATTSIVVLGKVGLPGVHILPKFENDVGHALAAAGGLLEESADVIEIHRRISLGSSRPTQMAAKGNQQAYPVKPANFREDPSGFSYWEPEGGNSAPVLNEYSQFQSVPRVSPLQQMAQQRPAPIGPDPLGFEPWQATARSNPSMTQFASNGSLQSQIFQTQPPSTPWQAPATNYSAPLITAFQPNQPQFGHGQAMEMMPSPQPNPHGMQVHGEIRGDKQILRIPLRNTGQMQLSSQDISLKPGDVVVVPSRRNEVFYVVGLLNTNNSVRFTVGDRERELGVGFILPREREIDVVTAVAMAGYIDPIESPTTVTVHRTNEFGEPFLIHVDLIKARYNSKETVLVQAGDIIYLNPDSWWWWRRTFDRVVPDFIIQPFRKGLGFD